MTEDIDLSEIDKKYKDKCSLIKAGKCKNVNIFLQQSRENTELKEKIKKYATINEQETKDYAALKAENEILLRQLAIKKITNITLEEMSTKLAVSFLAGCFSVFRRLNVPEEQMEKFGKENLFEIVNSYKKQLQAEVEEVR